MIAAISQRSGHEQHKGDTLEASYVEYFGSFGIKLVLMPNDPDSVMYHFQENCIDGVILSGGGDVHPKYYGGSLVTAGNYSTRRDETEKQMLSLAFIEMLPVLGICRGMQSINVNFGGGLTQSIVDDVEGAVQHVRSRHGITISKEAISEILGSDTVETNSFHNSGIRDCDLSPALLPFATATDGTVEGLYCPNNPLAAIMWHPERERSTRPIDRLLTEAFKVGELFWERGK